MDIAISIEKLLTAAEYSGSTTANTEEAWESIRWTDTRRGKPTWAELVAVSGVSLDDTKAAKIAEINAGYSAIMAHIQEGYPPEEVLSWERQATQARALALDPNADAAFVRALAETKGVTVTEMCRRILANAAAWEPLAASLTAQRQLMVEAAESAGTPELIEAITVNYKI